MRLATKTDGKLTEDSKSDPPESIPNERNHAWLGETFPWGIGLFIVLFMFLSLSA